MPRLILAIVLSLSLAPTCAANDDGEAWLKFFVGEWTRKIDGWAPKGEWRDSSDWTCEFQAGGRATLSRGTWKAGGPSWLVVSSWKPNVVHFEHGVTADGISWTIEFQQFDRDKLLGKATAHLDGEDLKGPATISRLSPNAYETTLELKNASGKLIFRAVTRNERKR